MEMAAVHLFTVVVVASTLLMNTNGVRYNVGGSTTGWTNPTNTLFYSDWALGKSFNVGDVLVFTFSPQHTVTTVDESDYSACTTTSPIATTTASPVSITLNTTGTHYYMCTVPGHCLSGQKLAVNVTGSATGTNGTSSSPPSTPPRPPSGSGATATVASFFLVCVSIVIGLLLL